MDQGKPIRVFRKATDNTKKRQQPTLVVTKAGPPVHLSEALTNSSPSSQPDSAFKVGKLSRSIARLNS